VRADQSTGQQKMHIGGGQNSMGAASAVLTAGCSTTCAVAGPAAAAGAETRVPATARPTTATIVATRAVHPLGDVPRTVVCAPFGGA